jgi:hypothetical protein
MMEADMVDKNLGFTLQKRSAKLSEADFIGISKTLVANYTNEHTDKTVDIEDLKGSDVYCVWYCKTLQNHKGLFSTPRPDGMYYEITYNGDAGEYYFDAYKKFDHKVITV